MNPRLPPIGTVLGRLTFRGDSGRRNGGGNVIGRFDCACGVVGHEAPMRHWKRGSVRSCGCLRREAHERRIAAMRTSDEDKREKRRARDAARAPRATATPAVRAVPASAPGRREAMPPPTPRRTGEVYDRPTEELAVLSPWLTDRARLPMRPPGRAW